VSKTKEAWEHIAGELPQGAWKALSILGITKRAYAELIAPQRVREAAEAKGWTLIAVHMEAPGLAFVVDNGRKTVAHAGPDICSAAWAAIQALGGGE